LPAVPKSCGAYQCAGDVCPSKCFVDDDCIAGLVCLASVCTKPVTPDGGTEAGVGGAPDTAPDASTGGTTSTGQTDAGTDASNSDASNDASNDAHAGAADEPDASTKKPSSGDKGGCGCRVPGPSTPSPLPLLLGLGVGLYTWRRRRSRSSSRGTNHHRLG
jgi:MYXO-CTERM domain-containing protein